MAVYSLYLLKNGRDQMSPALQASLQFLLYGYALSIVWGRLYCGMHGFFDVITGSALGAFLALIQCQYGESLDRWLHGGDLGHMWLLILIILVLVRIHPEPADDCPCFDDSVAFAGVVIGCEYGVWHFAQTSYSWSQPTLGTVPFDLQRMGWGVAILRIVVGVLVIFTWRGVTKPLLLKILPPIFRVIDHFGLTLPRRFFTPASEYKTIPRQEHDDNVIPPAREIPHLLSNFRRRRAVSIGPQSEADAYETLAYRDKRRRDSLNMTAPASPVKGVSPERAPTVNGGVAGPTRQRSGSLEMFRAQMGAGAVTLPPTPGSGESLSLEEARALDDLQEKEIFSQLEKPRVRYDVEVVTKLIVYSGIAWLAVEGNPILFQHIGLGPS